VNVKEFGASWNDGLAFCALIHHHRPDILSFDELEKAKAADNCELAFQVAADKLGIARLLDVEDIAENPRPDDKSLIAYLSAFYKLFASQMKDSNSIKCIERAVAITRRHDKLIADYNAGSSDLNGWTGTKTAELEAMPFADNTEGIKNALDDFYSYKSNEKPAKQGKLLEMEGMLGALQSSCKNNDRPVYAPAIGAADLEGAWEGLEKAENAYESALRDKYAKFQEVDFKTAKFRAKAGKMSDWAAGAQGRFAGNAHEDPAVGAVEAETMVDGHKIYESQLDQYKQTLLVLLGIVDDVKEVPEHADSATVAGQADELQATMANLEGAGAAYGEALDAKLAEEQRLADLLKNASKTGELLLFELDNVAEAIDEPVIGNSAQALADQLALLNGDILLSLDAVEDKLKGLEGNVEELAAKEKEKALRAEILNLVDPDANIIDDLRMKHGKRAHRLVTQQAGEERKEKLRLAFAEVANQLRGYTTDQQHEVEGLQGSLAEQLAATESLAAAHEANPLLNSAEAANEECEGAGIIINPHTPETIHSLRALWAELTKTYARARDQLQENILAEEGTKLTPEQFQEIKEVFAAFDQDGDNALSLAEFKEGCEGMGLGLEDNEVEDKMRQYTGGVESANFEQFTQFMLNELETGSTQPDVLNAFQALAGGPVIANDKIVQSFKTGDLAAYLGENMPDAEGGKDYGAYTVTIFES
jgi:Ca2+-binding EF-hand superfamily protein